MIEENSAYVELAYTLRKLHGCSFSPTMQQDDPHIDDYMTCLKTVAWSAEYLSEQFTGVNNNLKNSWASVSLLASKIQKEIEYLISNFATQMHLFIEQGQTNEKQMEQVAQQTNEATQAILAELGIE